ncbi:hypothetical protein CVT24_011449 [Panaeolus cyanescens]|uniref:F-box domain-containing protein n=1 Tax=Panaeolus cyanescens TaxID=181874 RepID=A0A409VGC7_9AGAR|nr:hypothetical protein CVT24_011449 [Panaeolus cyanescens]
MSLLQGRLNFDVLTNVITLLQEEKEEGSSSSTTYKLACSALFALARTCEELKDPSLKALWRRQDRILPVLKLIPRFTQDTSDLNNGRNYWFLDGFISKTDWQRFDVYARLIEEIHFHPRDQSFGLNAEKIHDSVYVYILSCRESVLFPRLSKVFTEVGTILHLFCSPALRYVSVTASRYDGNRADPLVSNYVNRICAMSPNIQSVALNSVMVHTSALQRLLATSGIRSLQFHLSPDNFHTQFLEALDMVPTLHNLESLAIFCLNRSADDVFPDNVPMNHVQKLKAPNLRDLHIRGTLESIAWLCESIEGTSLRAFKASLLSGPVLRTQSRLYERIWKRICHLSCNQLEEIYFQTGHHQGGMAFEPMTADDLLPLYRLQNLVVFSFEYFTPFVLANGDLELMARSWPYLQILDIPLPIALSSTKLTAQGIKTLAELCPYLERLDLTFDATDPSTIPRVELEGRRLIASSTQSRLWRLNVNDSHVNEACIEPLAVLLKQLFPNIQAMVFGFSLAIQFWSRVRNRVMDFD